MSKKLFNFRKLASPLSLVVVIFILVAIPLTVYTILRTEETTRTPEAASGFPTNFKETQVVGNVLSGATAMEFAPDGRLFVAEQSGRLRVIKNPNTSPQLLSVPFVTLSSVDPNGERGLLGIAFDPSFASNNFIYLYYTTTQNGVHNRIIRLTASGDVAASGSQVTIMDLDGLSGATNHNGGAIHFGTDGKLYIAVGDNANSSNAQSVSNRHGKILRINPDGSIPSDNPASFTTANGTNQIPTGGNKAIYAMGFRNPFTFDINPVSGKIYVNDVGNSGGNRREEVNDVQAGKNYGWPNCEGSCSDSRFTNPIHNYPDGCAITGGTFYNPSTNQFPAEYVGDYFFSDYCGGWIKKLETASPGSSVSFASAIDDPVDLKDGPDGSLYYLARNQDASGSGYIRRIYYDNTPPPPAVYLWCEAENGSPLVAPMQQGSDAAAASGKYIYSTANDVTNAPPTTTGSGVLTFNITEAGNYRFWTRLNYGSGEANSYWVQFDNDINKLYKVGNEDDFNNWHWVNWQEGSTGNIIMVNLSTGQHTVKLIGREANASLSQFTKIDKILLTTSTSFVPSGVGDSKEDCTTTSNQAPTATITTPTVGTQYNHGDTINFSGTGTDPEDGTLPTSAFVWDILFFHDDGLPHTHPHLTIPNGSTPATKSGTFSTNFIEFSPNVHYVVRLTVSDSGGKTHQVTRDVLSRKVNLTVNTVPTGLKLTTDGNQVTGPNTFQSVVNYPRTLGAVTTQSLAGKNYTFTTWSDGGAATHTITTPATNTSYTATFQEVSKPADINGDGNVGGADLAILVNTWASTTDLRADLNHNNRIDSGDLAVLISKWGT